MDVRHQFFERLVYGSVGGQRFTQDSPIMPDVWIHYGVILSENRCERLPLLLTPNDTVTAGELAKALREAVTSRAKENGDEQTGSKKVEVSKTTQSGSATADRGARIAYNQTVVAADLLFEELVCLALPLSYWWKSYFVDGPGEKHARHFAKKAMRDTLRQTFLDALNQKDYTPKDHSAPSVHIVWLVRVVGTLELLRRIPEIEISSGRLVLAADAEDMQPRDLEDPAKRNSHILEAAFDLFDGVAPPHGAPVLWRVNRNRDTLACLTDSVPAIKADAGRRVFEVSGRNITWAVLDSGIDARHPAFRQRKPETGEPEAQPFEKKGRRWINRTRIRATYDFIGVRDLLSIDPETGEGIPEEILQRVAKRQRSRLRSDLLRVLKNGRVLDWELLRPWLEIPHEESERYRTPRHPHGTHVAGILGADWRTEDEEHPPPDGPLFGVAPEISLVDLRVLDDAGRTDEFSVMAGLQFIRHLNATHDLRQIHGANLSFSLRHDFTVFACGQTPVCQETERLIGNGTVVVAAAGNEGMARYKSLDDRVESGYRSISITDPGNAEKVITVGSTHRRDPHTYGVSYFSSRGPTGDGRRKPDLVAPGEKITSTWPDQGVGEMDGTSQAAPHVCGAAALLMERNPELIGQPERIKRILCEAATDLGREPYFQGAGMLDILRALQSI